MLYFARITHGLVLNLPRIVIINHQENLQTIILMRLPLIPAICRDPEQGIFLCNLMFERATTLIMYVCRQQCGGSAAACDTDAVLLSAVREQRELR